MDGGTEPPGAACSAPCPPARGLAASALETTHRPVRFGERDSSASLLDLATRMLAVLCAEVPDVTEVVAVESAFAGSLVDQAPGAVLGRDLVERDADGGLGVVDLKTA